MKKVNKIFFAVQIFFSVFLIPLISFGAYPQITQQSTLINPVNITYYFVGLDEAQRFFVNNVSGGNGLRIHYIHSSSTYSFYIPCWRADSGFNGTIDFLPLGQYTGLQIELWDDDRCNGNLLETVDMQTNLGNGVFTVVESVTTTIPSTTSTQILDSLNITKKNLFLQIFYILDGLVFALAIFLCWKGIKKFFKLKI